MELSQRSRARLSSAPIAERLTANLTATRMDSKDQAALRGRPTYEVGSSLVFGGLSASDWASVKYRVYPGFPTPFWGLSGFFVGDLIGKALWELVENAQRFPRHGGRVLCVHGAVSFHRARPCATRWLPGRGPMRDVELDRCVLGLQSTGEQLCSRQHRRPVHAERSIYPGKTGISGAYAIWETRI